MASTAPPTVPLHSHDGDTLKVAIPCMVLGLASVLLRFYTKIRTKTGVTLDDWFLFIAFVFYCGYWGCEISNVILGVTGVPATEIPPDVLVKDLKGIYATAPISVVTITFARYSILWLYWRLFPIKSIQIATISVAAFCTAWGIASVFATIFKCVPVSASWDIFGPPGKCVNFTRFFLAEEPFNMIADLLVVVVPIHVIRRLHMPLAQKLQLCFVFAVGLFTSLISAIRIGLAAESSAELASAASGNWLFIQLTLAIIAVSLPTYGPLLSRSLFISRIRDFYASLLSRRSRSTASRRQEGSSQGTSGYQRTESRDRIFTADASGIPRSSDTSHKDLPLNAITVKKTVDMV